MNLCVHQVNVIREGKRLLDTVSMQVESGLITALVGPNGAGKSTLLKVVSGDIVPSNGGVTYAATPLVNIDDERQSELRSVMAQSGAVVFDFQVDEVIEMGWVQGTRFGHLARAQTIRQVARRCACQHLLQRRFNSLSGGEQQRVQFARALLQIWQPEGQSEIRFLLLDEPTASLDLAHELMVLELLREQAKRRVGVLIVLHDLNLAARFADHVVLLRQGQIVTQGPPAQVLTTAHLSEVYQAPVRVEQHPVLERLVIHTV